VKDQKIINRISAVADLQDEPLPGLPLVEIAGDCRVLVERHMGVTEYGKEKIVIKVRKGQICVCGSGMELIRMTKSQLVIKGTIFSVNIIKE